MPQPPADRLQFLDRGIDVVGLGHQHLPVDPRRAARRQHRADFIERQPARLAQRDQGQLVQHRRLEPATDPARRHRRNQALALVEAQGIAQARPVPGELALGWIAHYATGLAFAALLAGIQGLAWLRAPTLVPAVATGVATVAVPLFLMQPGMGAGVASSRTPAPLKNCLRSVLTHAVFGLGLYLSAMAAAWLMPPAA